MLVKDEELVVINGLISVTEEHTRTLCLFQSPLWHLESWYLHLILVTGLPGTEETQCSNSVMEICDGLNVLAPWMALLGGVAFLSGRGLIGGSASL